MLFRFFVGNVDEGCHRGRAAIPQDGSNAAPDPGDFFLFRDQATFEFFRRDAFGFGVIVALFEQILVMGMDEGMDIVNVQHLLMVFYAKDVGTFLVGVKHFAITMHNGASSA
ncbi:hypothetical protein JCM17843_16910 [Kordiimonadales bacterium JCM 17843]|nr:hypothetical protein JCM17843_16910 [Kordiimonadales bacterium JCM 17843]